MSPAVYEPTPVPPEDTPRGFDSVNEPAEIDVAPVIVPPEIVASVIEPSVHAESVTLMSLKLSPRATAPRVWYTCVMLVVFADTSEYIRSVSVSSSALMRALNTPSLIPSTFVVVRYEL